MIDRRKQTTAQHPRDIQPGEIFTARFMLGNNPAMTRRCIALHNWTGLQTIHAEIISPKTVWNMMTTNVLYDEIILHNHE